MSRCSPLPSDVGDQWAFSALPERVEPMAGPQQRRLAVFAAFVAFGLASWIMTDVTYVELGAFLRELPEEYSIYAYSIFALESANVYPMLYMLVNLRRQRLRPEFVIWWLLAQGVVVAVLMSALWSYTTSVGGTRHSVAMLVLTHLGGMVSTTSSVVFYPFVATYDPVFTSALSTGEGISGSIAALLGVVQEPYDERSMRFSVSAFYLICALIMCVSIAGFAFLQCHPWAIAAAAEGAVEDEQKPQVRTSASVEHRLARSNSDEDGTEDAPLVLNGRVSYPDAGHPASKEVKEAAGSILPDHVPVALSNRAAFAEVWQFLACQYALAAFSFGVLPSVMPYVYKKYAPLDNLEAETSRYQTTSSIAALILDPIARMTTSRWRAYYVRPFTVFLLAIGVMLLCFSLVDTPVLSQDHYSHGYLLPLLSHVFYLVLYAYTQTMIYFTLKRASDHHPREYATRVYQWSGFATQLGALTGTAIIFPLVFFREDLFTT